MAKKPRKRSERPMMSPEQQENRLVTLAVRRAEEMLEDGTAPPSVIVHYLKLGTSREKLEQEKLQAENEMLKAKAEALAATARGEEMYQEVLTAFRSYAIGGDDDGPSQDIF